MRALSSKHLKSVELVLAEPQASLRQAVRGALQRQGFSAISDFARLEAVHESIEISTPDLVVIDSSMTNESGSYTAVDLIRNIRQGNLGSNPFVPIIVMLWQPTRELVTALAEAGPDDLLVKPVAPATLLERIIAVATDRKQFMVTSNYIGPDRRSGNRNGKDADSASEKGIEVPNTLQAKINGKPLDNADLTRLINQAKKDIDAKRLERNADQIEYLVERIAMPLLLNQMDEGIHTKLDDLIECVNDCRDRMSGDGYVHTAKLCRSLTTLVAKIRRSIASSSLEKKDIELLIPVSKAIVASVGNDAEKQVFAQEIVSMMVRWENLNDVIA